MKPILTRFAAAIALTAAIAACVPRPEPQPTPAPTPAPAPRPVAPSVATPTYDNWMDAPQTPGDWRYRASAGAGTGGTGTAEYMSTGGQLLFRMSCTASRDIELAVPSPAPRAGMIQIRTETADRTLPADARGDTVALRLNARDPLLDAMALSKGRFAVELPGARPLYLPAWAEVTRVIEDCR